MYEVSLVQYKKKFEKENQGLKKNGKEGLRKKKGKEGLRKKKEKEGLRKK